MGNEGLNTTYFRTLPDTNAPDTFLTLGPAENSTNCSLPVTFVWSGTDDVSAATNLAFCYVVDGGAWTTWSNVTTASVAGLSEGQHALQVRAKDQAGNVDETPAIRHFVVNAMALVISMVVASPAQGGCTVTWRTDEPADSRVQFGLTSSYGQSSPTNAQLVTNHTVILSGLLATSNLKDPKTSKEVRNLALARFAGIRLR